MKRLNIILFLLALAVLTVEAKDLKVAGIFGDNMVLQQKTVTPIWGWADAGTTVTVTSSWNDKSYSAKQGEMVRGELCFIHRKQEVPMH